ncbi:hypothetical protein [Shewanella algae]|uniref:hypothetical protein n=1 Tax=Shewanella algae TaxID=38313 RepID=UPI001F16850F|nr:hypothetical protein [Shewanella algae]
MSVAALTGRKIAFAELFLNYDCSTIFRRLPLSTGVKIPLAILALTEPKLMPSVWVGSQHLMSIAALVNLTAQTAAPKEGPYG